MPIIRCGTAGATSRDGGSGAGAGGNASGVTGGIGVQTALANGSQTYFGGGGGHITGRTRWRRRWQAQPGSTNTGSGGWRWLFLGGRG
jgi:hypothetical protein